MNVLFIWDSDYPWDIRVSKICKSLVDNCDKVHLVCRNQHRRPEEEFYEGIYIHRLFSLPASFGKLNSIFGFPLFFSPVWLLKMYKVAKKTNTETIIVRDLPMAPAALLIGSLLKIPVILDMAECYPELIRLIWKFEPFRLINIIIRNPKIADIVEKFVLKYVDHIWVMIEESKNRLLDIGVEKDKVSIVSNTPVFERFQYKFLSGLPIVEGKGGALILLYVGYVNYSRGLDVLIGAIPYLLNQGIEVYCVIIGTGTAEKALKDMVAELGISDHVRFEGWVDNEKVPHYISGSDVCLVPHHKCSHWDHTIPNKLFDYMAAGKPVIVSDAIPMQRIISESECGMVFKSGNVESLSKCLFCLTDPNMRSELGRKGKTAVENQYNWNREVAILLESIQKVLRT